MTVQHYFAVAASLLDRHWAIADHQTEFEQIGAFHGRIRSRVTFLDGLYLDFSKFVAEESGKVKRLRYRYQYLREGQSVFRYDNFPRHPGVPPPYHHFHSPDGQVLPINEPPTLLEVIEQIAKMLFEV